MSAQAVGQPVPVNSPRTSIVNGIGGATGSASPDEILDPNCDPNNPQTCTFDMVKLARQNVQGAVIKTPLVVEYILTLT